MAIDYEKEKRIIDECNRLGEKIPDRIANRPVIEQYMMFYIDAFFELTTERQIGFVEGPIPLSAIHRYADRLEMNSEERIDFHLFITRLDATYLKYKTRKEKANSRKKK